MQSNMKGDGTHNSSQKKEEDFLGEEIKNEQLYNAIRKGSQ